MMGVYAGVLMLVGFPAAFAAGIGSWAGGLVRQVGAASGGVLAVALGIPAWIVFLLWCLTGDRGGVLGGMVDVFAGVLMVVGFPAAFAAGIGSWAGGPVRQVGAASGGVLAVALGIPAWIVFLLWCATGDRGGVLANLPLILGPLVQIAAGSAFATAVASWLGAGLEGKLPGASLPAASVGALLGAITLVGYHLAATPALQGLLRF